MDGRRKALIVANDEYDHEGLRHLLSPAADAEALARVLGDRQIGAFEVETVRNQPAHVIQTHIEDLLADSSADDVLLLHFSCHGLKSESGELFFAARNTRPNRLSSTAISADFVQRCMRASRSRSIVLLLDCCYGGAFGKGVTVRSSGDVNVSDSFPENRVGGGRGRAVITASSSIEYAFEGDQLADDNTHRPSVFTTALVEGLATGDADRDEDGWVSLNELYDYVFERVRAQTPHQTPSRDVEMQGELYLARSRRKRIKPMPIPADLQAAMTDPNMFSRLGAVSELRTRLLSENLPSAVGAYEALAEIARTDIQYVADPAKVALAEAALSPSPASITFPPVEQGAESPQQEVRLQGPPIAQAAIPHADAPWIHLQESAESFVVTIETTTPGPHTGTITLKGPSGQQAIPVTSSITPHAPTPTPVPPAPTPEPPAPTPAPAAPKAAPAQPPAPPTASPPVAPVPRPTTPVPPPVTAQPSSSVPQPAKPPPIATPPPSRTPVPPAVAAPQRTTPAQPPPAGPGVGSVFWALMPVLSLGLLTPVPFFHAAGKLKDGGVTAAAVIYSVVWVGLLIGIGSGIQLTPLVFLLAIVATIHAFVLRPRVFAPTQSHPAPAPPVRRPATASPQGNPVTLLAGTPTTRRTAEAPAPPSVPHFRVVALGVAGSGKTVYLSSMFHTVNVPTPGRSYFLETNAAHRVYLSKVFDEVSDTSEPWPRGTRTGETRELAFDCVSFDAGIRHTVFRISYLDYAGELLESEQEAGSTALSDLETRIRGAHGLLCMLDGYRVLQYLRNEPAGRRYFRSQIQPMTGIMAGASCPIHFVLTKWDLVRGFGEPVDADENTRLNLVRNALLETAHLRALIETHTFENRVIRLIPVSAVGPHFAQMDQQGHVLKLPGGEVEPANVEVPLTAILPDLFRQVESSLDPATRRRLTEEARARRAQAGGASLDRLLAVPAGAALRQRLHEVVGGSSGKEVMGMFLDWMGGASAEQIRATGRTRQQYRAQAQSIEAARTGVLDEFATELDRLEQRLPASRLSGRQGE
ncbi:caspase family protein [Kribbella sp. NBC_00382]|uniref:caspase family protein n=1 Tax=Kribbella sp. NBC_00382 TaxID=2975967 RepID=UPI002E1F0EFD